MEARFAKTTEAEIVALLEKATPENTKKQLNMEYIIKQLFHSRRNELIANSALRASLTISSCTTRACGIIVNPRRHDIFDLKFSFLDRLPKALAQLFFVC